ncbi:serine hydrolase domain-containing protein [Micromonospora sp. DT201]|uniref:serine hydrolase domain-containing protein n=1 Tax=Micromonospora sp. DT201 TaxID=3393442 RepID=UPI003CF62F49
MATFVLVHGGRGSATPGSTFEYSNTNYIVLGLLIRAVTGRSYAEEIRARIIEPLGLTDTVLPGDDPNIPGVHARGYMKIKGKSVDVTEMNPSEACSAGEMISTTKDLDRFLVDFSGVFEDAVVDAFNAAADCL